MQPILQLKNDSGIIAGFCRIRNGFVLWTTLLLILLLGIFTATFSYQVQHETRLSHHHLIAKTADFLARSALEIVIAKLGNGLEERLAKEAPGLYLRKSDTDTAAMSQGLADELKDDLNVVLAQLGDINYQILGRECPTCTDVKVEFKVKELITPVFEAQLSRDPVEKLGEVSISCSIRYHGVTRKIVSSREFKLVSMVPGPYSRFTLFVPHTPMEFSYNSLGVDYTGAVDGSYVHPWPNPVRYSGPLVIKNATAPQEVGEADDETDLQNHGWVFLGPVPDQNGTGRTGAFYLKLSSGYNSFSGGNFHYLLPPCLFGAKKVERLPYQKIEDPEHFTTPEEKNWPEFMFLSRYEGFFTRMEGDTTGAQGLGLWDAANGPRWKCASSWVMPYGNRDHPSRTLIVGPALAGFLKAYFFKGPNRQVTKDFLGIIRGMSTQINYDQDEKIRTIPPSDDDSVLAYFFRYAALFKKPTTPPFGWESFTRVFPYSSIPQYTLGEPAQPIAYNKYFDFMKYASFNAAVKSLPPMKAPPSLSDAGYDEKSRLVPNSKEMRPSEAQTGDSQAVAGIHPWKNVKILLPKSDEVDDSNDDAVYFHGDLGDYNIQDTSKEGLFRRITNTIDLTNIAAGEQDKWFQSALFRPSNADDSCGTGFWIPSRSGIFYVQRPENADQPQLSLPGKIYVDKPLIILINKGNIVIRDTITTGNPARLENLFSIVAIDGDILVDPQTTEIHAYLTALKPGNNFAGGGGRLLSTSKLETNSLNITGGLAAWEIGLYFNSNDDPCTGKGTTMEHFPAGGSITYNPYFNPSSPLYERSRTLIFQDAPWMIQYQGGS